MFNFNVSTSVSESESEIALINDIRTTVLKDIALNEEQEALFFRVG